VDDDLDGVAGVGAEVGLGCLADRDGLGAVGLPAGSGQLRFNAWSEDSEADNQEHPHGGGEACVRGHGDAEATERAVA
jgi:hypothetical protein